MFSVKIVSLCPLCRAGSVLPQPAWNGHAHPKVVPGFFWNYLSLKMTEYTAEDHYFHPIYFLNDQLTTDSFIYWYGVSICVHDRLLNKIANHFSSPMLINDYIFFFSISGFTVACGDLAILFPPKSIACFFDMSWCTNLFKFSYSRITYFPPETRFLENFDLIRIILFLFFPTIVIYIFKLFYFKPPPAPDVDTTGSFFWLHQATLIMPGGVFKIGLFILCLWSTTVSFGSHD